MDHMATRVYFIVSRVHYSEKLFPCFLAPLWPFWHSYGPFETNSVYVCFLQTVAAFTQVVAYLAADCRLVRLDNESVACVLYTVIWYIVLLGLSNEFWPRKLNSSFFTEAANAVSGF